MMKPGIFCDRVVRVVTVSLLVMQMPVMAQESSLPAVVQVEGAGEVLDTLRRIEQTLEQIRSSQWEYRFLQRNVLSNIVQEIEKLGLDGWELVNVTNEEGYIFKRQVMRP